MACLHPLVDGNPTEPVCRCRGNSLVTLRSQPLPRYLPEMAQMFAGTDRKQLLAWRFNPQAAIATLAVDRPAECLCYTRQEPLLYFSGCNDGSFLKWERTQLNPFMCVPPADHPDHASRPMPALHSFSPAPPTQVHAGAPGLRPQQQGVCGRL